MEFSFVSAVSLDEKFDYTLCLFNHRIPVGTENVACLMGILTKSWSYSCKEQESHPGEDFSKLLHAHWVSCDGLVEQIIPLNVNIMHV